MAGGAGQKELAFDAKTLKGVQEDLGFYALKDSRKIPNNGQVKSKTTKAAENKNRTLTRQRTRSLDDEEPSVSSSSESVSSRLLDPEAEENVADTDSVPVEADIDWQIWRQDCMAGVDEGEIDNNTKQTAYLYPHGVKCAEEFVRASRRWKFVDVTEELGPEQIGSGGKSASSKAASKNQSVPQGQNYDEVVRIVDCFEQLSGFPFARMARCTMRTPTRVDEKVLQNQKQAMVDSGRSLKEPQLGSNMLSFEACAASDWEYENAYNVDIVLFPWSKQLNVNKEMEEAFQAWAEEQEELEKAARSKKANQKSKKSGSSKRGAEAGDDEDEEESDDPTPPPYPHNKKTVRIPAMVWASDEICEFRRRFLMCDKRAKEWRAKKTLAFAKGELLLEPADLSRRWLQLTAHENIGDFFFRAWNCLERCLQWGKKNENPFEKYRDREEETEDLCRFIRKASLLFQAELARHRSSLRPKKKNDKDKSKDDNNKEKNGNDKKNTDKKEGGGENSKGNAGKDAAEKGAAKKDAAEKGAAKKDAARQKDPKKEGNNRENKSAMEGKHEGAKAGKRMRGEAGKNLKLLGGSDSDEPDPKRAKMEQDGAGEKPQQTKPELESVDTLFDMLLALVLDRFDDSPLRTTAFQALRVDHAKLVSVSGLDILPAKIKQRISSEFTGSAGGSANGVSGASSSRDVLQNSSGFGSSSSSGGFGSSANSPDSTKPPTKKSSNAEMKKQEREAFQAKSQSRHFKEKRVLIPCMKEILFWGSSRVGGGLGSDSVLRILPPKTSGEREKGREKFLVIDDRTREDEESDLALLMCTVHSHVWNAEASETVEDVRFNFGQNAEASETVEDVRFTEVESGNFGRLTLPSLILSYSSAQNLKN